MTPPTLWSSFNDRLHVRRCLAQGGFHAQAHEPTTVTRAAAEKVTQAPKVVRHG